MAAPFARLEIWSDLVAASGTRLAFVPDLIALKEQRLLNGQDQITAELRRESDAWAQLRKERVLRVMFDDGAFDEWRISLIEERDNAGPLIGTIVAVSPLMDLARGFLERTEADGTAWPVFELLGLTPSTLISTVILPAAPSYFALGTVDPTAVVDMRFEADTPLAALRALAQLTQSELAVRRNGTTNYLVDLLTAVGSGATVTNLRVAKNLRGVKHSVLPDDHGTRIYGIGGGEEDVRLTIAGARWKINAITGSDLTLADPAGGDAPLAYNDQLNNLYLRKEGAASSTQITASVQSTQKVTVASTAGLAVNDSVAIEKNGTGDDLIYLEAPADKATYGLLVGILKRADLPSVRNFVANPQLNGVYTAGLPSNWVKVGTPTTAEETGALFTRRGGKSCKVTATADGQGIETAAITITPTTTEPYFSVHATFQIASGRVRVEFIDVTNSRTYPDGTTGRAWSNDQKVWVDRGVAGLDLNAVATTSVKLRIIADGGAATFYVDSGQITQTAGQQPFFAGVGATQLWQAVNDELVKRSVPTESLDVDVIDLHRYDPTAWPYEELIIGGTVKIVHGDLGLDRSTRIVSWTRDLVLPMVTDVVLSNRPEDLTEATVRPDRRPRRRRDTDTTILPQVQAYFTRVTSTPQAVKVRLTARPAGATIKYVVQDAGLAVPVIESGSAWLTYAGEFTVTQKPSTDQELFVYAFLGTRFGEVQPWRIDKDASPSIVSSGVLQTAGLTVKRSLVVDVDVRWVLWYRRTGNWPTSDGTQSAAVSQTYFKARKHVLQSGGGWDASGNPIDGGLDYSDDSYTTGNVVYDIVIAMDERGNTTRHEASYTTVASAGAALTSFTTSWNANGTACTAGNRGKVLVSWAVNGAVTNADHDLKIYRELDGGGRTLVKTESSPATVTSYTDEVEDYFTSGGPLYTWRYTYELVNTVPAVVDSGQASPDIQKNVSGLCPI